MLLILTSLLLAPVLARGAQPGQVCLSQVLNKVILPGWEARNAIQVDGGPIADFTHIPRVVATGLDFRKRHRIKILWDGKATDSWTFKFETPMMNVYFTPGGWKMSKNPSNECQ